MKTLKLSTIVNATLALCLIFISIGYRADEWNKKTKLSINETLTIPGAVLTPGEYVFKLMDSSSNRHIVQVFNEDESHVIATILAIPNERLQPTGKSEFTFWEMPTGTPAALRSWFYPGDNFGQEFAFPKEVAQRISASTKEKVPVLSEEDESRFSGMPSEQARVEPPARAEENTEAQAQPAPSPAPSSEPSTAQEPTQESQVIRTPAPTPVKPSPAPEPSRPATTLPATSTSLPLLGLLGGVSFTLGIGLRIWRRIS